MGWTLTFQILIIILFTALMINAVLGSYQERAFKMAKEVIRGE